MKRKKARARIGCAGFSYPHWKDGVFYPAHVPQNTWLEYYAGCFSTVELNVTFYRLPDVATFSGWADRTPDDFKLAVKGSKLITHVKEFSGVTEPVKQFMERAIALGDKLGPVLWQTPPAQKADRKRLSTFIKILGKYPETLHAFEFRHGSWFKEPVYKVIRDAGMCVVSADYKKSLPQPPQDFSFIYVRRHGCTLKEQRGNYPDDVLAEDAKAVKKALRQKRDVYVFFNNDLHGFAPMNAITLQEMI